MRRLEDTQPVVLSHYQLNKEIKDKRVYDVLNKSDQKTPTPSSLITHSTVPTTVALRGFTLQWGKWASSVTPSLLRLSQSFSQFFLKSGHIPGICQNFLYFLFTLFWEGEPCSESGQLSDFGSSYTVKQVVGSFNSNDAPAPFYFLALVFVWLCCLVSGMGRSFDCLSQCHGFLKNISYFISFKHKSSTRWRWKVQRMPKSKEKKTITCNLSVQSGESPLGALVTLRFFLASCSLPFPTVPPHSLGTAEHFGSTCSCAPVLVRH